MESVIPCNQLIARWRALCCSRCTASWWRPSITRTPSSLWSFRQRSSSYATSASQSFCLGSIDQSKSAAYGGHWRPTRLCPRRWTRRRTGGAVASSTVVSRGPPSPTAPSTQTLPITDYRWKSVSVDTVKYLVPSNINAGVWLQCFYCTHTVAYVEWCRLNVSRVLLRDKFIVITTHYY